MELTNFQSVLLFICIFIIVHWLLGIRKSAKKEDESVAFTATSFPQDTDDFRSKLLAESFGFSAKKFQTPAKSKLEKSAIKEVEKLLEDK